MIKVQGILIIFLILFNICQPWMYGVSSINRSDLKLRCPQVKAIRNLDLESMMGFWYVVQYYASSEELPEYACMRSRFTFNDEEQHVTMNFTYIYAEDPFREQLQGNITWKIPNFDIPAHWIHTEDIYEGIYNTYIIDTDYKSWGLLMHCAEKSKSPRYLSALLLSREPILGANVVNFLREKLPRYDIDLSFMFPINQNVCDDLNNTDKTPLSYAIQDKSKIIMCKMRIKRTWLMISLVLLFKFVASEDVEVIKAITPDESIHEEIDTDQIAQESNDQEQHQVVSYQHQSIGPGPGRGNIPQNVQMLGQPFGPPPPPHLAYHGPPPPLPAHLQKVHQSNHPQNHPQNHPPPAPPPHQPIHQLAHQQNIPDLNVGASATNEIWASPTQDMPKIISLDVKCEKNGMKVYLQFDKPFFGIVFSKGHYSNSNCVHLPAGVGRNSATFDIGLHACGTSGNTENGLYGYGTESGSGTYFENIIVIQYDQQVQEVWDQARKLRCTWHDQYEKSVTFRPFPVDMLDVVRADFAGDNVGCWMQIQVGKGPWASEVSGLVKIGQTMTMVLAIKDDDSKFDMLVRNCVAHDGKRAPIQLVDQRGCVTRPKLMSRFTKIKNFGASASVLSYAHFQAFKFPDSMEVHFQCTIQICRYQCPEQCSDANLQDVHHLHVGPESQYGPPPPPPLQMESYLHSIGKRRDERRDERRVRRTRSIDIEKDVGMNRVIKVVSSGDLTFAIDEKTNQTQQPQTMIFPAREEGLICMTTPGFAITLIVLLAILIVSCLISAFLCIRLRPFSFSEKNRAVAYTNPQLASLPHIIHSVNTMPKKRIHS